MPFQSWRMVTVSGICPEAARRPTKVPWLVIIVDELVVLVTVVDEVVEDSVVLVPAAPSWCSCAAIAGAAMASDSARVIHALIFLVSS